MISIIVPAFNSANYLVDCLDSIANQDFYDYEVLVINDGSLDNTGEIARQYCDSHKNFKYFQKENGGLMSSYLFALDYVGGDYIGFVDSDDIIEKDMFSLMYSLSKDKNADIVMCDYDHFPKREGDGKSIIDGGFYSYESLDSIRHLIFPPFNGLHISNSRVNKIFKTKLVFSIVKYLNSKSRFFEDRFFTTACFLYANSFYYLNKTLYHVRSNLAGQSNSTRAAKDLYKAIKILAVEQKSMLLDLGIFDLYKKYYEAASLNFMGLFITRNILLSRTTFKEKYHYAKQIIFDNDYRTLVKNHKKELTGKKGKSIKLSFSLKSPLLLVLLCKIARK